MMNQEPEPHEYDVAREPATDEEAIALESITEEEVARLILFRLRKDDAPEYTHMSLGRELGGGIHPEAFYAALWTLAENDVVLIEGPKVTLGRSVTCLDNLGLVSQ
jgi:hypothetical protein